MNIRSRLSSLREYLTPINNESNFLTTGEISPEEFVVAGDYLVQKFPTWSWGASAKGLQKAFLPPEKQYLVTRHVPSYRRYASFVSEEESGFGGLKEEEEGCDSDMEVIPSFNQAPAPETAPGIASGIAPGIAAAKSGSKNDFAAAEIDLDAELSDDYLSEEIDDYAQINTDQSDLRKYDLYISYSTSYRVPKMYLVGFNGNGIPLLPSQMYEDISGDHKDKTATIEALPMAKNTTGVSIHPCKHASVMKVFMEHARKRDHSQTSEISQKRDYSNGKKAGLEGVHDKEASGNEDVSGQDSIRVDHYLVIFLKFIASVTPGIEYDFTMDAL